jgi:4-oxalmesaconate hydratase
MRRPLLDEHLLHNVYFDTCIYHLPGVELLTRVIPIDNILFASEMLGAVKGIDPQTGHHFDDTKRYLSLVGPGCNAFGACSCVRGGDKLGHGAPA